MNVLIAGSSGLIGTALVERLTLADHTVTRLVRGAPPGRPAAGRSRGVAWDPAAGTIDMEGLERAGPFDGVVNLAGAGIGDRRWSMARKKLVRGSRVSATSLLAGTLLRLSTPPAVLVSASAVGFYGDRGDEELTETSTSGTGFLASVCRAWEAEARSVADAGIRTVLLRSGIVLSRQGGALRRLLPIFRAGLGGRTGTGAQYRSWITITDEVNAIVHCLGDNGVAGPVNATAPSPVTDADLARTLGAALHRPSALAVPAGALRLLLGAEMADELVLGGQRVLPTILSNRGFEFAHADIDGAVRAVIAADG
jgi:uncharacterized protein (TIGR01777 family)